MGSEAPISLNIPVMDLRCFCQDELLVAAELSGHFPEAWYPNLIIPALDKNLFNTSLASRKQTYRRRPWRAKVEQSSSVSSAQAAAAAPRQSGQAPRPRLLLEKKKARCLLEKKKTKETLKPILTKNQRNSEGAGLRRQSEKPVAGSKSLISKKDLNLHFMNSQSGGLDEDEDADASLQSNRQMECTSEATDQPHRQALQPTLKRMRLKAGARNRLMFKKQAHSASEGGANSQQVSRTECLDCNPSSFFQGLQNPKRVLEIAIEGGRESCKKEEMEFDVMAGGLESCKREEMEFDVMAGGLESCEKEELEFDVMAGVDGETATFDCLSKVEAPWISRHMEKNSLVARGFVMGWEVTDHFRR